ncbi:unnamed protein product [Sympodiomycopsis kandeliae]
MVSLAHCIVVSYFFLSLKQNFTQRRLYYYLFCPSPPSTASSHPSLVVVVAAMADHFARAAGFAGAGEETTEVSFMPPRGGSTAATAGSSEMNPHRNNFDATMDETEYPTSTGIQPPQVAAARTIIPPQAQDQNTNPSNNRADGKRIPSASTRIPPQRVPFQPSSNGSRSQTPTNGRTGQDGHDDEMYEEEDESEEYLAPPNLTVANDTTMNSADTSEWERHIKESKKTAGVGMKQMQQRIDNLLQERDDLKIEVDMLRRQYNPDERASELIRLRQENIRITNHRITLSDLLTGQKKVIRDLQRQAKQMSSQNEGLGTGDRELRKKLSELEEALRLVDSQRQEEQQSKEQAEEELQAVKNQVVDLEQERNAVADELDQVKAEKEDLDQELYKLEKERDEAQEGQRAWQTTSQEHEARIEELESEAEARLEHSVTEKDEEHQRQLEQLEEEVDVKTEELQRTQLELQEVRGQLESANSEADVFKGEVDAQRIADEERYNALRDELSSKENELMQLEEQHEELLQARKADEDELAELGARYDDLEKLVEEKENEVVECNREIAQQAEVIRQLEEEQDMSIADARDAEQQRSQLEEDLRAQDEHHEMKVDSFKARLADSAAELAQVTEQLQLTQEEADTLRTKLNAYRERMKDRNAELEDALKTNARLDEKVQDLLSDLRAEESGRDAEEAEWEKKIAYVEDDLRKIIDERDDTIAGLEEEVSSIRQSLQERDGDLEALQRALQSKESDLSEKGRISATDRHSLELELDRLRRDLSRCESDLSSLREELDRKDDLLREKSSQMNKMYSENCEYSAKLATETQTRLGLDERLASMKSLLKEAENALEVVKAKNRSEEMEKQKKHDEDDSNERMESSLKRQLVERNGLLVTVNQQILKVLSNQNSPDSPISGGGGTPGRRLASDPKPSQDFGAFHGVLIQRLKKLSELKSTFEKRTQQMETRSLERFTNFKRQQESRFRQIDRLEGSLKSAADKQNAWRSRVVSKQSELDSAKGTINELQSQISSLKTRTSLASPADNSKLTTLTSRANTAEKRLLTTQNQLTSHEGQLNEMKSKYSKSEAKWAARIAELENRCKIAEEKIKRERQGAKERIFEQLELQKNLQSQVDDAQRRLRNVDEMKRGLEKGASG